MMSAKRGEKMLDDRKKKVLKAIVEEYINTAEPVGSVALTQNEDLKYSSATIRNEMADLEKEEQRKQLKFQKQQLRKQLKKKIQKPQSHLLLHLKQKIILQ